MWHTRLVHDAGFDNPTEAERAILGCLIADPKLLRDTASLAIRDFQVPRHRRMFLAILQGEDVLAGEHGRYARTLVNDRPRLGAFASYVACLVGRHQACERPQPQVRAES